MGFIDSKKTPMIVAPRQHQTQFADRLSGLNCNLWEQKFVFQLSFWRLQTVASLRSAGHVDIDQYWMALVY
jgi:hypothetical protein